MAHIRVIVTREGNQWKGVCKEQGLVAIAPGLDSLKKAFRAMIAVEKKQKIYFTIKGESVQKENPKQMDLEDAIKLAKDGQY